MEKFNHQSKGQGAAGDLKGAALANPGKLDLMLSVKVAASGFKIPEIISTALALKVKQAGLTLGQEEAAYYQAVCAWMARNHDFVIKKTNIVTTPGVKPALNIAINAYSRPNDAILITTPGPSDYVQAIEQTRRQKIECLMILKDGQYYLDPVLFEQKIIKHQVKIFILANPYHPLGKVWSFQELRLIGEICLRHEVMVIVDETHQDFVFKHQRHWPLVLVDKRFKEFTITTTTAVSSFNLAGFELANVLFFNEELKKRFVLTKQKAGFNDVPDRFVLEATKTAYNHGQKWLDERLNQVVKNRDYLKDFLVKNLPELTLVEGAGLNQAWVDFSSLDKTQEQLEAFMINEAKLWLEQGYEFGMGGAGFALINLAVAQSVLKEILERLNLAIKTQDLQPATSN